MFLFFALANLNLHSHKENNTQELSRCISVCVCSRVTNNALHSVLEKMSFETNSVVDYTLWHQWKDILYELIAAWQK